MSVVLDARGSRLDIIAKKGITIGPYTVTVEDETGSPVDLTGATITGTVTKTTSISMDITVIDDVGGVFSFGLSDTATASMVGTYTHRILIEFSSGVVKELYWGEIKF